MGAMSIGTILAFPAGVEFVAASPFPLVLLLRFNLFSASLLPHPVLVLVVLLPPPLLLLNALCGAGKRKETATEPIINKTSASQKYTATVHNIMDLYSSVQFHTSIHSSVQFCIRNRAETHDAIGFRTYGNKRNCSSTNSNRN